MKFPFLWAVLKKAWFRKGAAFLFLGLACVFFYFQVFYGGQWLPSSNRPPAGDKTPPPPMVYKCPPMLENEMPLLKHSFPVHNSGTEPVKVIALEASCACSSATMDRKDIEPGGTAQLTLEARLAGRIGGQAIDCKVFVEGYLQPWLFSIHCHIQPRLAFSPQRLSFGKLPANQPHKEKVVLYTFIKKGAEMPQVKSLASSSREVAVQQSKTGIDKELSDGSFLFREHELEVTIIPKMASGVIKADITVLCLLDGVAQQKALPITWQVKSPYQLQPESAFFGEVKKAAAGRIEKKITITRLDGKAFPLRTAKSSHAAVRCLLPENTKAGTRHEVILVLDAKQVEKYAVGEVVLETGDQTLEKIIIPFSTYRTPRPAAKK